MRSASLLQLGLGLLAAALAFVLFQEYRTAARTGEQLTGSQIAQRIAGKAKDGASSLVGRGPREPAPPAPPR